MPRVTTTMKTRAYAILLIAVVMAGTMLAEAAGTNKVGVMKFEVGSGLDPMVGKFLSETFTSQLVGSKQYTVVDWESIDRVLGIVAKSQPTVSAEDARKMAISQLGLEKMFFGNVVKLGSKYNITVKLLSLDLRIEQMERGVAESEEKLPEAVEQMCATFLLDNSDEAKAKRAAEKARAEAEIKQKEEDRLAQEKAQAVAEARKSEEARQGEKQRQQETADRAAEARRKASPAHASQERPWTNSLGMVWVPVPGTKVLFCIWETRVRDFDAFVQATGYDATAGMYSKSAFGWSQRGDTWRNPGLAQGPTHPVCGVNWDDAYAFCRWLTSKEQPEGRLAADQSYRLPTDAEWSLAVGLEENQAGTPKDKSDRVKKQYPWGPEWPPPSGADNYAPSLRVDTFPFTAPVGSFNANRHGLYDLGGNLWELCEEYWDKGRAYRVIRGGCWDDRSSTDLLSSHRGYTGLSMRSCLTGFRCVLGLGAPISQ